MTSRLERATLQPLAGTGRGVKGLRRLGRATTAFVARLRDGGVSAWTRLPQIALASVVRQMAETGVGTDECLQQGCLPMPVHFYSPVPDIADLKSRRVWDRRNALAGIDLREERQLELLAELGRAFGPECRWPHEATGDPYRFYTDNTSFSYGCAAATHAVIRHYRPRRVIEIGSGWSSRVIAAALRANAAGGRAAAHYTIVDPYPAPDLAGLPGVTGLERQRVELLDVELFAALGENDVLFVDSGHTVRIGGDVNFLVLDVLPRLRPGVIVHFHDIPWPQEYAEVYFTSARFRVFWTEAYLLQAFLAHNHAWEILLAMNWLMTSHAAAFAAAWPHYDRDAHRFPSHSVWIRRVRP